MTTLIQRFQGAMKSTVSRVHVWAGRRRYHDAEDAVAVAVAELLPTWATLRDALRDPLVHAQDGAPLNADVREFFTCVRIRAVHRCRDMWDQGRRRDHRHEVVAPPEIDTGANPAVMAGREERRETVRERIEARLTSGQRRLLKQRHEDGRSLQWIGEQEGVRRQTIDGRLRRIYDSLGDDPVMRQLV